MGMAGDYTGVRVTQEIGGARRGPPAIWAGSSGKGGEGMDGPGDQPHEWNVVEWNASGWAERIGDWVEAATGFVHGDRRRICTGAPPTDLGRVPGPFRLVVLVAPPAGAIEELAAWLEREQERIAALVIGVVDCAVDDLDAIVDAVRRLPRWPSAWFQADGGRREGRVRAPVPPCPL